MQVRRRGFKKARIEIIPMIDTIFFLLVFFMIATLSMSQYRGLQVNLPKAASGAQPAADNATITLTKEGRLYLDKQEISTEALVAELQARIARKPDLVVIVNADHAVAHGAVVEVMDAARRAGAAKLAIAVKPKDNPG
jgi:biopolymer transport protein ExbD